MCMYPTKSTTTIYAATVNMLVFKIPKGSGVILVEIHTAKPLLSESSAWETELSTENFERYKSEGNVQIQAELNLSEMKSSFPNSHIIILFIYNKKKCPSWNWLEYIILSVHRKNY